MSTRIILHIDMDAFFAAVEQRDRPEYRGKPVVVGADPKGGRGRGVVSTCSYEARKFGIHSAQPISEAWRRCPTAVFVYPRMDRYDEVSHQVFRVLEEFTPVIEPISIDEAFLDVTASLHLFGNKRVLAERLQMRVEEATGLTASVGVAPNKLVAKIASDLRKPRGLVIVEPCEVEAFLRPLPVRKLWGVGVKTEEVLKGYGIATMGDLADFDRARLTELFGVNGEWLWRLAHGQDDRPVETDYEAKSIGAEHTFEIDTADDALIASTLMRLCEDVSQRLWDSRVAGRTVTTKIRFEDFTTITRRSTLPRPVHAAPELCAAASENLERGGVAGRKLRLIGVAVSHFTPIGGRRELTMFDEIEPADVDAEERKRHLAEAIAKIKQRHGPDAIRQAGSLRKQEPDE